MKELKAMGIGAIAMVTLSVICLFGIAITTQMGENQKLNTAYSENITLVWNTSVSLTNDEIVSTETFTLVNASNTSQTIPSTNYSVDYTDGAVTLLDVGTNASASTWNGTSATASYTYEADTAVTTTAVYFKAGLVVFATFSALVSLMIVGKLILDLLRNQKKGEY